MPEIWDYLSTWDATDPRTLAERFGLFIAGALFLHLWNKFRDRTKTIRWSSEYQRLAVAGEDALFGRVEVLYNDNPVQNLYMGLIQVENESTEDFQNVDVNFSSSEGGQILVSTGALEGSLQALPFTGRYQDLLQQAHNEPENLTELEFQYLVTRRDYQIPVLNRGAVANFGLLIHREDALPPSVELSCDHVGVELVQKPAAETIWGVSRNRSLVAGLLLTFAAVAALVVGGVSSWILALSAWALGLIVLVPGALAVKVWRRLVRLLS